MDRQEYVQAGQLQVGERLQTLYGDTKTVVSNLPRPGPKTDVYNLEVHAEHVYFVGEDGVLVHNSKAYSGPTLRKENGSWKILSGTAGKRRWKSVNGTKPSGTNLNSNNAVSEFGVYEIAVNDITFKFGKADFSRVTGGLPTRLHTQVRKLSKLFGENNVTHQIVDRLGITTTAAAKAVEHSRILDHFQKTGMVPLGNWRSFKP